MNYKTKIPIFAGILFCLVAITPNAYAALLIDDFTDGASSLSRGSNCIDSDLAASVLGSMRNMFVCRDSGAGTANAVTDTTAQQFVFTLNAAAGSSGLNYDNAGALLGMVDLTQGGTNNILVLDFIKVDKQTSVTVEVADSNGGIGTFQFDISSPQTKQIEFAMIVDPLTMTVPDFTKIEHVGVFFEGEEQNVQDTELILGSISVDALPDSADLTISKSDSPDPVVAGNILTYTVRVSNAGPSDAQNVVVTDTLPAGVTFLSTSGCAEDPNADPACTLGTIPSGAFVEYTISVSVDSNTIGVIQNTASVASSTALVNPADDSTTEFTTVVLEEICNDGIDNDGDGLVDGADPDCAIPNRTLLVTVLNEAGEPVSDANCTVSDPGFGIIKSGITDANGEFMADFMINDGTQVEISCSKDGSAGTESLFIDGSSSFAIELELSFSQVIGGEIIPLESASLLLAGAQSVSWMIPVALSVLGIGLFVVSRKSENS